MQKTLFLAIFLSLAFASTSRAQDNYEIQVYGSETLPEGFTMVEVHSNFTINGSKNVENGVLPTRHAFHETLEITHGINKWFEVGFYVFTSARNGNGWHWGCSHIRPPGRSPDTRELPGG